LIGALTDGDVGAWFDKGSLIDSFSRWNNWRKPKFIVKGENNIQKIIEYREEDLRMYP
jgi:hypothetical protein